jgi:Cytochrome c554 and c-prime
MAGSRWKELFFGIGVSGSLLLLTPDAPSSLFAQFATPDHVSQPQFWPTQTRYQRSEYTGSEACAGCHRKIFIDQQGTSMAHTAMRSEESSILRENPQMDFAQSFAHYGIHTEGGRSVYSVSDGRTSHSEPLVWAFGTNRVAQSYLFKKKDGEFHEARVTYFLSEGALDFTPGRALNSVSGLDEAMDRQVSRAEVYRCFACHTTASGMDTGFSEERLMPGIGCEACHGPGQAHLAEAEGNPVEKRSVALHAQDTPYRIFNPKRLTPEESVDFCGSCHGSFWDVSLSGSSGEGNARFQPYRLEQSKCWNKNDARLTCVACHDPHKQVDTDTASYDHVCLSCHLTKNAAADKPAAVKAAVNLSKQAAAENHPGAACPVATKNCSSCHMPQVYVPAMRSSFPDHRIRIAREGEAFPD